ncbi:hypothetical protein [Mitsuokella sp. oral taxon 131]|uniref:hypothetical protein n=1 Tax=Mitsuokella sp. oral taxon 131 TaxID=1321780 RepID=UPI0012DE4557|nr:hypothetical protein [Mitsuokella sp. oral taxon 131]
MAVLRQKLVFLLRLDALAARLDADAAAACGGARDFSFMITNHRRRIKHRRHRI